MQPFYIGDVLSIENGVRLTKADMCEGIRPFIGASESNNGVTGFINNTNSSLASNILGVNYNGSVGFSFYHPYEALFSDDVKRVRWKDEEANNKVHLTLSVHSDFTAEREVCVWLQVQCAADEAPTYSASSP